MIKKKTSIVLLLTLVLAYPLFSQNDYKFSKRYSQNERLADPNLLRASFCFYPSVALKGEGIKFCDLSIGDPDTWCWSFGDGQLSHERNPKHRYLSPSVYFITLEVKRNEKTSQACSAILVRSGAINALEELKADFIFEPENPQVGVPVRFYDISTGNPTKRTWQFGYFDYSFSKQPIKTFLNEGDYKITLTVEDQSSSDKATKYIKIAFAPANIVIAKSCALADVQAAIATAKAGDTVVVPAGTATWNQQLIITKGIVLKGAGIGKTIIKSGWSSSSDALIRIQADNQSDFPLFRMTGFEINGNNLCSCVFFIGAETFVLSKFRFDHNKVYGAPVFNLMKVRGHFWGVIDNNVFIHTPPPSNQVFDNMAWNDYTWNKYDLPLGSVNNLYWEDNVFTINNTVTAGGQGGRYCFRYNTINYVSEDRTFAPLFDAHGNQVNGVYSIMVVEIYNNAINSPYRGGDLFDQRGGKAIVFGNTVTGSTSSVWQKITEEDDDSIDPTTNPEPQYPHGSYYFLNRHNGALISEVVIGHTIYYSNLGRNVPMEDLDFWVEKANFNGSSGVGVGPLAQRPSYCTTEGVAWWATDENKLYRWHNGQWELYYTPYTYPHPLRTSLND